MRIQNNIDGTIAALFAAAALVVGALAVAVAPENEGPQSSKNLLEQRPVSMRAILKDTFSLKP